MGKYLKIKEIKDISPRDLDGHRFRLFYAIGSLEGNNFRPEYNGDVEVNMSGTLQAMWNLADPQVIATSGSFAANQIIQSISSGRKYELGPINLNTFTAPQSPPSIPVANSGTLIPIPETEDKMGKLKKQPTKLSILSEDISEIRDNINAISINILRDKILELPQERPLIDMYRDAETKEEFNTRIQSLAGLVVAINKEVIGNALSKKAIKDIGSLSLLEELLLKYSKSTKVKSICGVFKRLNDLRNGYPAHGDNVAKVLEAYKYFGIKYPIEDFSIAWETILGKYFEAMRNMLDIFANEFNEQ